MFYISCYFRRDLGKLKNDLLGTKALYTGTVLTFHSQPTQQILFLRKTVTIFICFTMDTYLFVCCMDVFSQLL